MYLAEMPGTCSMAEIVDLYPENFDSQEIKELLFSVGQHLPRAVCANIQVKDRKVANFLTAVGLERLYTFMGNHRHRIAHYRLVTDTQSKRNAFLRSLKAYEEKLKQKENF